jgi:hypothetical protein
VSQILIDKGGLVGAVTSFLHRAGLLLMQITADPSVTAPATLLYYRSDLHRMRLLDDTGAAHSLAHVDEAVIDGDTASGDLAGTYPAPTIASGAVVAAKLGANAVTGPALSAGSMRLLGFAGHNGAGACTLTGAKVGDTVVGVVDVAVGSVSAAASFESTITVNNQIQQSSASDLSAIKYLALVVAKS